MSRPCATPRLASTTVPVQAPGFVANATPTSRTAPGPCTWALLAQMHAFFQSYTAAPPPVNLLADLDMFDGHLHCELTLDRGMLVLHPDLLLSGTRITTSHECPRRSFLDERVAGDGSNDKAVKGTLTHNLIQARARVCMFVAG